MFYNADILHFKIGFDISSQSRGQFSPPNEKARHFIFPPVWRRGGQLHAGDAANAGLTVRPCSIRRESIRS